LLLEQERDGWAQLKVLELCDRLAPAALAPALMQYAQSRKDAAQQRVRFLAARACEVLLRLPLDLETRARAAQLSQGPLQEIAATRGQAIRARALHRPRRVEWAILI